MGSGLELTLFKTLLLLGFLLFYFTNVTTSTIKGYEFLRKLSNKNA